MFERRGSADANPSSISLIALKPRQILLAERQKKNTTRHNPMAKNETENKAQLKPEQKSLLFYSFALCLQNHGFSKTLKRFISEAQIKGDDWEARALNLEDIFSKYLKTCNEVYTNVDIREDQERQADGTWEENGFNNSAASKGNVRKKKKNDKNDTERAATGVGKTSEEVQTQDKFIESNVKSKTEKNKRTDDTLVQSDHELLTSKQVTDGEVPVDEFTRKQKEKKIKKSKLTSELFDGDEMPKLTEEKSKDLNDSKDDSAALVESKDKKKRKKVKKDCRFEDGEKGSLKNISKMDADNVVSDILLEEDKVQGKEKKRKRESTEKSVETVEDGVVNEYVASKKRKQLAHDEDGKQTVEDIAVEESKRRKTDGQEEATGAEQQVNGRLNGVEKSSQSKSMRKQINSYHEPKMVNAFQRVKVDEVKFVDERLQDNSYWAKDGADTGYGAKAQEILGQVRGRDFRHEKTKKKRGSYRGGQIDLQSHSIKFNYSDEE